MFWTFVLKSRTTYEKQYTICSIDIPLLIIFPMLILSIFHHKNINLPSVFFAKLQSVKSLRHSTNVGFISFIIICTSWLHLFEHFYTICLGNNKGKQNMYHISVFWAFSVDTISSKKSLQCVCCLSNNLAPE